MCPAFRLIMFLFNALQLSKIRTKLTFLFNFWYWKIILKVEAHWRRMAESERQTWRRLVASSWRRHVPRDLSASCMDPWIYHEVVFTTYVPWLPKVKLVDSLKYVINYLGKKNVECFSWLVFSMCPGFCLFVFLFNALENFQIRTKLSKITSLINFWFWKNVWSSLKKSGGIWKTNTTAPCVCLYASSWRWRVACDLSASCMDPDVMFTTYVPLSPNVSWCDFLESAIDYFGKQCWMFCLIYIIFSAFCLCVFSSNQLGHFKLITQTNTKIASILNFWF